MTVKPSLQEMCSVLCLNETDEAKLKRVVGLLTGMAAEFSPPEQEPRKRTRLPKNKANIRTFGKLKLVAKEKPGPLTQLIVTARELGIPLSVDDNEAMAQLRWQFQKSNGSYRQWPTPAGETGEWWGKMFYKTVQAA